MSDERDAAGAAVLVRPARLAERDVLVTFQLAMARETESKDLEIDALRRGVERVFEDPARGTYWVALVSNEVAGSLLVTREWSDWRDAWFWWIQSVYVHERYRRQGVYAALHRAVEAQARAAGDVCGLRLYVESQNARARRSYERMGMARSHYEFYEAALSPPGPPSLART